MARSSFQKLKTTYVMLYLLQNSDEEHPVTVHQIIDYLESKGISAERKSIYSDIEALQTMGIDIIMVDRGRFHGYYVASRVFELPELKLLVDSVQSSKFITHKKTAELIKKIEQLASIHEAQLLNRQVFVKNRIKSMNESIYYNVDEIHTGISSNRKIRFRYFEYDVYKEKKFRRDGAYYVVSPYAMTWDDENYYLVAYESGLDRMVHYRVDKMAEISVTEEERDGQDAYKALDLAVYTQKTFGMFSGDEVNVQLRFRNYLVGAVLDRLGRDVFVVPDGHSHFTVRVDVVVSPQFFAWVLGFGDSAQILGPGTVVEQMRQYLRDIERQYKRSVAKTDVPSIDQFKLLGTHVVTFARDVVPYSKVIHWFNVSQTEKRNPDEGREFMLGDLNGMTADDKIVARGRDYQRKQKVAFICLDGIHGKAIVVGTEPYAVEFEYCDGMIRDLTCNCSYTHRCKHEIAAMLQLREALELIQSNYSKEFAASGYFAALSKSEFCDCVMDNTDLGGVDCLYLRELG